ncbi:hypothetical protein UXO43_18665 [Enterobacter hormaechei]
MKLFEMEGFLRGKCLPGDMKVNETNAEYLVRKFAEADAKCAALAAELSAVETIHNDAVFITDDHYEQCPPEVQKIIRSLAVMQIPAYQAFLAEVRAQGVDALVERRLTAARLAKEAGHEITARDLEGEAIRARIFAMELRKGVQS